MHKVYVKADPLENPEAINDLASRLGKDVSIILTDKDYTEIVDSDSFLYYRNPYIRFDYEQDVIKLHKDNKFGRIITANNEVVSINAFSVGDFKLHSGTYHFEPSIEPLPILIGTHRRPDYLKFTLNSILYSLQSDRQKVYIVLSDSDEETKKIVRDAIQRRSAHIEAVVSDNNVFYGWVNFITKFFDVGDKAILFDEDVIVPENLKYRLPFWTSQLNYRLTTADIAALKVSKENYTEGTLKWLPKPVVNIPDNIRWYYSRTKTERPLPIGGMGMAITCDKHLRDFKAPEYGSSDSAFCGFSKTICIANIPLYHIGVNEIMDYPEYCNNKPYVSRSIDRYQTGTNLTTGETKTIDMQINWSDH